MNLTDRLPLVALLLLILSTAGPAVAQDTPFDRLIERFREGEIFSAEFEHQYIDSYTGDTTQSEGTMWVGRDKYRVQSRQQSVVVNNMISRVYDENRNRVIISEYEPEEDDFAPSRFLNGVDSTYTVSGQEKVNDLIVVTLTAEDPFALFAEVEITLNDALIPLRISAKDQVDNQNITRFHSGEFIPYKKDMFILEYPSSAEIIDMRND